LAKHYPANSHYFFNDRPSILIEFSTSGAGAKLSAGIGPPFGPVKIATSNIPFFKSQRIGASVRLRERHDSPLAVAVIARFELAIFVFEVVLPRELRIGPAIRRVVKKVHAHREFGKRSG
jgi:hypothetical protein